MLSLGSPRAAAAAGVVAEQESLELGRYVPIWHVIRVIDGPWSQSPHRPVVVCQTLNSGSEGSLKRVLSSVPSMARQHDRLAWSVVGRVVTSLEPINEPLGLARQRSSGLPSRVCIGRCLTPRLLAARCARLNGLAAGLLDASWKRFTVIGIAIAMTR